MYQFPTQPQSIREVLASSLKLYVLTFRAVIGFALAGAVITALPELLIPDLNAEDPDQIIQAVETYSGLFPVFLLIAIPFYNAIYYRMYNAIQDASKDYASALAVGIKKTLPVAAALILYCVIVMLGLLALMIPGVVLALSLFFYQPLIVLDDEGIGASLKVSHRLVWGNWWRTATVLSIPMTAILVILIPLAFVFDLTEATTNAGVGTLTGNVLSILASAVFTPLFIAITLVQFNDLKRR